MKIRKVEIKNEAQGVESISSSRKLDRNDRGFAYLQILGKQRHELRSDLLLSQKLVQPFAKWDLTGPISGDEV